MSVTADQRESTASGYVPVRPFPVAVTSVLAQNQIATDHVLVDLDADGPVATFTNPLKGGAPEAFAVVDLASGGEQVVYVAQDSAQQSGWSVGPLPGGPGAGGSWPATAVVAAVTGSTDGLVDVFWNDNASLQHTWLLPDGSWAAPRAIHSQPLGGLGVAYAVGGEGSRPIPVVYGVDGAGVQLVTWAGPGHGWATTTFQGSGFSATSLTVAIVPTGGSGGQATVYGGGSFFGASFDFTRGATITVRAQSLSGAPVPIAGAFAQATSPAGSLLAYVLGTDQTPYVVAMSGPTLPGAVPIPSPTARVLQAVAVAQPATRAKDGTLLTGLANVYLVHEAPDGTVNLSLLRQLGWSNGGHLPQWAPPIPIASSVDSAYPILLPSDPDTVFLADRINEGALAVYTHAVTDAWRNPATGVVEWSAGPHWTGGDIRQQSDQSYDITSYIVQATVTDGNQTPMANYPLQLSASAPCGVVVGTSSYPVSRTQSTTVVTNAAGVVSFSIEATDLAPPSLILTDPDGAISPVGYSAGPVSISPAASVQAYMSTSSQAQANGSTGTLSYLPPESQTFSATMMTNATVPGAGDAEAGQPLFPGVQGSSPTMPAADAVTNVNNMMTLGYSPVGDDAAPRDPALRPKPGAPVGFIINNSDPTTPQYVPFDSGAELRAAWRSQHQQPRVHLLHDAKDAFSDAWKGIKDGATKVADVAVDMEKGVVSMAIWIGNEATEIGDFVITCVEDACNAIVAVYSALKAVIKDVIDFLKALLDFGNIFNTQWAFQQSLNEGLLAASEIVQWATQQLNPSGGSGTQSNFFSGLTSKVEATFGSAGTQFQGQTAQQAGGSNWQPMGQPPSNSATIAGATTGLTSDGGPVTPAQLSANPQAMWMQSQLGAQAAAAPASAFDLDELRALFDGESTTALEAAVDKFDTIFDEAMEAFEGGAKAFEQAFQDLLNAIVAAIDKNGKHDPNNLQNVAMADLLDAEEELLLGMLDFLDGVALTFLAMVDAGITWLLDVVNTPIKDKSALGKAVQLLYDGLWDVARLTKWEPPSSGWAPPAGTTIPGWDPAKGMPKDLTYAGLAGLVTGFPVCVLYEILTGKQPFPGGVLPDDATVAGPDVGQTQYEPILATVNMVNSLLTTARDGVIVATYDKAKVPKGLIGGLSGLAVLSGISAFIFQWRGHKSWDESIESRSIALASIFGVSGWLSALVLTWFSKSLSYRTRFATVSTLFGVLTIAYSDYLAFRVKDKLPPDDHAMWAWSTSMGNLAPIPDVVSLLLIPEAQEATEDIPVAGCLKLVVDAAWGVVIIPTLEIGEAVEVGRHT
ncbi:hypothetical protein PAI11_34230 [Patulibacter medicamentivorans]|uniref:Uncharacterized protein n=1 Tax=Patulibacter medicamentivorans TaxID=1097667 RepID=H0E9A6_9ACTN|nr:hypothetical protein [Patulibacter medicamentivorans]EHN09745.1 hypothetical protein PAI11_34230 [Patulibacter medicamentivorans]